MVFVFRRVRARATCLPVMAAICCATGWVGSEPCLVKHFVFVYVPLPAKRLVARQWKRLTSSMNR